MSWMEWQSMGFRMRGDLFRTNMDITKEWGILPRHSLLKLTDMDTSPVHDKTLEHDLEQQRYHFVVVDGEFENKEVVFNANDIINDYLRPITFRGKRIGKRK